MTSAETNDRPVGKMTATLAKAKAVPLLEVAERLGIHRNSLADKLSGRRAFTEDEIVKLADLFEVDPGTLFADPVELLGAKPSSPCRSWWRRLLAARAAWRPMPGWAWPAIYWPPF